MRPDWMNKPPRIPSPSTISGQFASARMTDAEIVAHYKTGTLLAEILRPVDTSQQQMLHAQLAALHNSHGIDLLALTATPEFESLDRRYSFVVQQAYGNAIPSLKATASDMLELIRRLEQNGGRAPTPRISLRVWLRQAPARAKEVIQIARSSPEFDREILFDALVALGDAKTAISFFTVPDRRRQAAIAALGAIEPKTSKAGDATLGELVAIVAGDSNEDMRFTAISAVFDLLSLCKSQAPRWVPTSVTAVKARPSDETRAALLHALWRHSELFEPTDVKAVLSLASGGNLADASFIGTLGSTLQQLVGGAHHELAVNYITSLLASSGQNVPLVTLQMLEYRLTSLDRQMLFSIAVHWFATGDHALCETISKLIGRAHDQQPFDASLAGFGMTGPQMIVLCHKAVAYMPLAPIVSASFIIAALRTGDKSAEPELVQLLLNTLLFNFRDTVAKYLKKIGKADQSHSSVRKALKFYARYENELKIDSPIKELQPSSYQRGVVRQNQYVANRQMMKQAERKSIFFDAVHRSTLLHGRKAIIYTHGADQPPTSMEMKKMSAFIEMPRLHTIDPVGLEWLFRVFRSSKTK